jgi:hypothetical protein
MPLALQALENPGGDLGMHVKPMLPASTLKDPQGVRSSIRQQYRSGAQRACPSSGCLANLRSSTDLALDWPTTSTSSLIRVVGADMSQPANAHLTTGFRRGARSGGAKTAPRARPAHSRGPRGKPGATSPRALRAPLRTPNGWRQRANLVLQVSLRVSYTAGEPSATSRRAAQAAARIQRRTRRPRGPPKLRPAKVRA